MTYTEIIAKVSESTGYTRKYVDRVYKGYWRAMRDYMTSMPFKEDLTDEEFLKLRPNINVPSLGKFHVQLNKYKRIKKASKIINEKYGTTHQENQAPQ